MIVSVDFPDFKGEALILGVNGWRPKENALTKPARLVTFFFFFFFLLPLPPTGWGKICNNMKLNRSLL